jgi:Pentapeptide repeats (8 copies)
LVCNGKFKGGLKPSFAELVDILKKPAEWVNDHGPVNSKLSNDPRRANLCGADLTGVRLTGTNLADANLAGANLDLCDPTTLPAA